LEIVHLSLTTIQSAQRGLQPHSPLHTQLVYPAMAWADIFLLLYQVATSFSRYVRSKLAVILAPSVCRAHILLPVGAAHVRCAKQAHITMKVESVHASCVMQAHIKMEVEQLRATSARPTPTHRRGLLPRPVRAMLASRDPMADMGTSPRGSQARLPLSLRSSQAAPRGLHYCQHVVARLLAPLSCHPTILLVVQGARVT